MVNVLVSLDADTDRAQPKAFVAWQWHGNVWLKALRGGVGGGGMPVLTA